jgi:heptaprenyl diphosphate synthase
MKLADIYRSLESDLAKIEEGLELAIDLDVPLLYETSTHLLKAGGKRIRPVFVLLSGQFGRYDIEKVKKIAIPLELIHMATLVHDDVIDNAATRRGQMTVKSKWDNKIAIYTGDYVFAKALSIATELTNPRIHRILANAIREMCIGEIEQIQDLYRSDLTFRQYLLRIKRKTALLISISCQLGALVSEADEKVVSLLKRFGYYVGMAFQITDDILDYTGTEQELGKPAGSDIRQGNITLPAIYALRYSERRDKLLKWIDRKEIEPHLSEIITIIRESGGIDYSRRVAETYFGKAKRELNHLPDLSAKKDLLEVTHFLEQRNY